MFENETVAYIAAAGALLAAMGHLLGGKTLIRYAVSRGVLNASQTIKFSALVLVVCAVLCLLPDFSMYGMYALAGYSIVVGFVMHKFWDESEPDIRQHEVMQFLKNMIIAAFLFATANPY